MDLQEKLNQAAHLLALAHPDPAMWSGGAARQYQAQLGAIIAELGVMRASLWL